jgi:phage tail sheath protein FI
VSGIYACSDIERGVYKAPANEVVRGLTRFESNINNAPAGRHQPRRHQHPFFEGRGSRVWGARTTPSDLKRRYVNVQRLFIFIEHFIDKGTQWVVFEPNGLRLWSNIRRTVQDLLLALWRDGALLGDKPEEAYFVRCDRTPMTQNDLDNRRMTCLVGVAPVKPAEYVMFRIGQWTAGAQV